MTKNEVASFSLMKIICISLVIVFGGAVSTMAFNMQINDAIKMVSVKYETIVTEEDLMKEENTVGAILNSYLATTEKLEVVVGEETTTYKVRYQDEQEVSREVLSSQITPKPVEKIIVAKASSRGGVVNRTEQAAVNTSDGYVKFTATGYCACAKCCGKSTGKTASGAMAQAGVTVAMSSKYAFGTQVEVKGMGTYTVQDRGGAITGNKIDIFFNTHEEALKFGRRTVEVCVY